MTELQDFFSLHLLMLNLIVCFWVASLEPTVILSTALRIHSLSMGRATWICVTILCQSVFSRFNNQTKLIGAHDWLILSVRSSESHNALRFLGLL